jgi:hypothetical protein
MVDGYVIMGKLDWTWLSNQPNSYRNVLENLEGYRIVSQARALFRMETVLVLLLPYRAPRSMNVVTFGSSNEAMRNERRAYKFGKGGCGTITGPACAARTRLMWRRQVKDCVITAAEKMPSGSIILILWPTFS